VQLPGVNTPILMEFYRNIPVCERLGAAGQEDALSGFFDCPPLVCAQDQATQKTVLRFFAWNTTA